MYPGKFLVIVTGDEGEVNEAIDYGVMIAENTLVDSFKVHAVSTPIIAAFKNKYDSKEIADAVGIMETTKVCAGIKALDADLKSSNIKLTMTNRFKIDNFYISFFHNFIRYFYSFTNTSKF